MVNASKILTVSYGTFSCTLEGFDDPFSTMRSIAEYFRDLAADDRYFGAEPPTPDAEMLHRIAEREINRRVEARVKKNGVVLRQVGSEKVEEAEPAQAPRRAAISDTGTAGAAMPQAAAPAQDETADVDAAVMDAATGESVAEKLRRIRAAVARSHVEPQFTGAFAEDEHAGELFRAEPIETAFEAEAEAPEQEPAEPPAEAEDAAPATVSETATEEQAAAEDETIAEEIVAAAPADETVADAAPEAKEAIEDAFDEAFAAAPDQSEDEFEEDVPQDEEIDLAAIASAAAAEAPLPSEPAMVEPAADADQPEADLGDVEDELAKSADQPKADLGDVEEEPAALVATRDEDDHEADEDAPMADLVAETPEEVQEAEAAEQAEDEGALDLEALTARLADANEVAPDLPEQSSEPAEDTAPAAPVMRARIVKMSRAEFLERYVEVSDEAADGETEDATAARAVTQDDIRASLGETGLSPEDEDDLINELFAAERDASDEAAEPGAEEAAPAPAEAPETASQDEAEAAELPTEETDAPDTPAQTKEEIAASLKAAVAPITKDDRNLSVDRLLRQTDSELNDNESSRRRSAIAHLKAAVAAVRAEGGRAKKDDEAQDAQAMNQFRDDLARVVRPEADAESPATGKPAVVKPEPVKLGEGSAPISRPRRRMPPLMLVSEQRIDKPITRDLEADPVRPRRVQADDETENVDLDLSGSTQDEEGEGENIFGAADDFSGYVDETGAEGVQDLLEASAAFGTLVEGQPFNSRPQIMQRMLRYVPEGTVTREEGLRAFGVLLREGRLIRIQRGQFVLPENSRFREQQKSAANNG